MNELRCRIPTLLSTSLIFSELPYIVQPIIKSITRHGPLDSLRCTNIRHVLAMFKKSSISGITLESAGLVALADLSTVAVRTALTGTASYLDVLVLAPGMHQQQSAVKINDGELPNTGSMTNGYVFRVENPATVSYLRHIGRTGKLVAAEVSLKPTHNPSNRSCNLDLSPRKNPFFVSGIRATLLYLTCPVLTIIVFALLGAIRDWWAVAVLGMLVLARFINVVVIKRRSEEGWKGKKEPGVFMVICSYF